MKILFNVLLFSWAFSSNYGLFSQSQVQCLATQLRQQWWEQHPSSYNLWQDQNKAIDEWLKTHSSTGDRGQVLTIPVVVHIVWNSPEENLPDSEIISQIEALNRDFRALNDEIQGIPSLFQPLIADVELEFCLATTDPSGNPTNGITRTFTNNDVGIGGTSAIHYSALGGKDAWDTNRYLNIWVAKFAGFVTGTSSFPGQGLPAEDGVEINYRYFGTLSSDPPYNLGRTLTHEVGHYFNLEHPWGPNISDCCGDDYVADTPEACETYLGQCPVHPVVSCDEPDMFMNYMFYTDDACMGMFTLGQKARMLAALNLFRSGLLLSGNCAMNSTERSNSGITVFPNPAKDWLSIKWDQFIESSYEIIVFDALGRPVLQQHGTTQFSQLNVAWLVPGSYRLMLRGEEHLISAHFFKM